MRRALAILALVASANAADAPPRVALRADGIAATVLVPDAEHGAYRGARFDWSGMVCDVRVAGHTLFAAREPGDPTLHDRNAVGTAEEFGIDDPPGYADAAVGGAFLKIGIGAFTRTDDTPYDFAAPRRAASLFPWRTTRAGEREVVFEQEGAFAGWGYRYRKVVSLDARTPTLAIARTLTNTGTKRIRTHHYGHHFLRVDALPIDGRFRAVFAGGVGAGTPFDPRWRIDGATLSLAEAPGESAFGRLAIGGDGWRVTFAHADLGPLVTIAVDRPVDGTACYADRNAFCVEPFVAIDLAPGESLAWTTTYAFAGAP